MARSQLRRGNIFRCSPRTKRPGTQLHTFVVRLGRSALRKRNGRYVVTKTDRLLRVLTILGKKGKKKIATRDSRQASLFGSHWAAVQRYLQIGDDAHLMKFNDKRVVDASGKRHRLLTNLKEL